MQAIFLDHLTSAFPLAFLRIYLKPLVLALSSSVIHIYMFLIINRAQKKGLAITGAAREKVSLLQEHANKVETLLNSMQDERAALQTQFTGAEQRCRWLEEHFREDKANLQESLSKYRRGFHIPQFKVVPRATPPGFNLFLERASSKSVTS